MPHSEGMPVGTWSRPVWRRLRTCPTDTSGSEVFWLPCGHWRGQRLEATAMIRQPGEAQSVRGGRPPRPSPEALGSATRPSVGGALITAERDRYYVTRRAYTPCGYVGLMSGLEPVDVLDLHVGGVPLDLFAGPDGQVADEHDFGQGAGVVGEVRHGLLAGLDRRGSTLRNGRASGGTRLRPVRHRPEVDR